MIYVEFIEDLRVGDIVIYDSNANHYGYVKDIYEDYDDNDEIYYRTTVGWFDGYCDVVWENHDISGEPLRVLRT